MGSGHRGRPLGGAPPPVRASQLARQAGHAFPRLPHSCHSPCPLTPEPKHCTAKFAKVGKVPQVSTAWAQRLEQDVPVSPTSLSPQSACQSTVTTANENPPPPRPSPHRGGGEGGGDFRSSSFGYEGVLCGLVPPWRDWRFKCTVWAESSGCRPPLKCGQSAPRAPPDCTQPFHQQVVMKRVSPPRMKIPFPGCW